MTWTVIASSHAILEPLTIAPGQASYRVAALTQRDAPVLRHGAAPWAAIAAAAGLVLIFLILAGGTGRGEVKRVSLAGLGPGLFSAGMG